MHNIQANYNLKELNTFGIEAFSKYFCSFENTDELKELLQLNNVRNEEKLILGGGSNLLFTKDFEGIVLKNDIPNIEIISEDNNEINLKVGAGVNWHEFVMYCVNNKYYGIENLSLIPGNVGAAPMQNIGAYGVEVKNVITLVEAVEITTGETTSFKNNECNFDYRSSIFKTTHKNQFIISYVHFKLSKQPNFNISYGAIASELEKMNVKELNIKDISQAVINIRSSKLPNPKEIGNAGSFFKNPVVKNEIVEVISKEFPEAPIYKVNDNESKLAAGWLIEQCGWKGKKISNYGVHAKQALVLVNYGGATGKEIYDLSESILESVKEKFNIELEREVNIY